jgi:hypothetical protein
MVRYGVGWVLAAVTATGVSYAAIENLVRVAALGEAVPAALPKDQGAVSKAILGPAATSSVTASASGRSSATPRTRATVAPRAAATSGPSVTPSSAVTRAPARSSDESSTQPSARSSAGSSAGASAGSAAGSSAGASAEPDGQTQGYSMQGGQVVLENGPTSSELISAVPAAGFRAQVTKTEFWIRVDFITDGHTSTLVVSWFEHAPTVQTDETA